MLQGLRASFKVKQGPHVMIVIEYRKVRVQPHGVFEVKHTVAVVACVDLRERQITSVRCIGRIKLTDLV